jgi:hypothetical protein
MLRSRLGVLAIFLSLVGWCAGRAQADGVADIAKYSNLPAIDVTSLAGGKIISGRGPGGGERDIAVQAAYVVRVPVAQALELHKNWDAASHKEMKVYLHHDFSTHPAPGDFSAALPGNGAVGKLASATARLPDIGDLQLSQAEASAYRKGMDVKDFWSALLFKRASAFLQHGLGGLPPYDTKGGSIKAGDEVSRLLREEPKVRAAFAPVIGKSPLGGGVGAVAPYWELINESGDGVFTLGAACSTTTGDGAQLVDLQYYASGGFYAYVTLYDMWPVTIDGKPATLVWRVDAISTEEVADLGPLDKIGSVSAMTKEVSRMIQLFQKDVGK